MQVFCPLRSAIYGLNLMFKTAQGMQQITQQGMNPVVHGAPKHLTDQLNSASSPKTTEISLITHGVVNNDANTQIKENENMAENSLANDQIKIVSYTIVSIRDEGKVIAGPATIVVSDNMDDAAFSTWVIAKYFECGKKIKHKYKKYLRVCYSVMCAYEKQESDYCKDMVKALEKQAKYQQKEVGVLKEIRDNLCTKSDTP